MLFLNCPRHVVSNLLLNSCYKGHTLLGGPLKNPYAAGYQYNTVFIHISYWQGLNNTKKRLLKTLIIMHLTSLAFEKRMHRNRNVCGHFAPQTLHFLGGIYLPKS